MMPMKQKWINRFVVVSTLILCYFPLCHRIDNSYIQLWDEARNVTNAIEMLNNGNWLTRYFENRPDIWELKPPLLVWCQALSLKTFGYTELAVRIPSMFFSLCTVLFLIWIGNKITGKIYSGALATFIMVSCQGYIGDHAARFGDHDVVLTFFSTVLVGLSFLFFETRKNFYLLLLFVSLFLGWAAKSITIFMFVPALILWAWYDKKLKEIVLQRSFWIGIVVLIALIFTYYFIREKSLPGYTMLVWQNELFGRYLGLSQDFSVHHDPFWYYLIGFLNKRFIPFIFIFFAGIIYIIVNKKNSFRKFLLFLLLNWLVFFTVISSGSKNFWYDMPLYPIASLFLGILIVQVFYSLKKPFQWVFSLIAIGIFYIGYSNSIAYTLIPKNNSTDPLVRLCSYLKDDSNLKYGNFKIYNLSYNSHLYLYIEAAKVKGVKIKIERLEEFNKGDRVVVTDPHLIARLDSLCISKLLEIKQGCEVRTILGSKLRI